jgi:hypothetical protein
LWSWKGLHGWKCRKKTRRFGKDRKKHLPLEVCEQASTMNSIRDVAERLDELE